jgi:hypothetical protein
MATDFTAIFNALETYALGLGIFGAVNGHEPKSPPAFGDALVLMFSAGELRPILRSGLNSVSYRLEILGRIYRLDKIGSDAVEPEILGATTALFTSLAGGFTLGGLIRHVDIYGSDGAQLSAVPGYLEQGDDKFRTVDLVIPLIINDVMTLGA